MWFPHVCTASFKGACSVAHARRPVTPWMLLIAGAAGFAPVHADDAEPWPVVGAQGLMQVVIVPTDQANNAQAYRSQIARLCSPQRACFINFHTNTSGVPAALPLPDAIAAEATARFRRSIKHGGEFLQWSCRLKHQESNGDSCF
jgi:hypothetical protein